MCRPILERGSAEVLIGTTAIVFKVGKETNENLVVRSLSYFVVGIVASKQSVPRSGPLCYLTGNYGQVVL